MSGQGAPLPIAVTAGGGERCPHVVSGPLRTGYAPRFAPSASLAGVADHLPAWPPASCALSPRPESVKAGRDFARATLRAWGMPGLTDVAELVVSELITNALRHGMPSAGDEAARHHVRVGLLAHGDFVTCLVTDPGEHVPVRRESGPDAESGRGLAVVESCSLRWGWQPLEDGGKVVWALLQPSL